jgi:hypothetical protein
MSVCNSSAVPVRICGRGHRPSADSACCTFHACGYLRISSLMSGICFHTEPTSTAQTVPRVGFHVTAQAKTPGNQVSCGQYSPTCPAGTLQNERAALPWACILLDVDWLVTPFVAGTAGGDRRVPSLDECCYFHADGAGGWRCKLQRRRPLTDLGWPAVAAIRPRGPGEHDRTTSEMPVAIGTCWAQQCDAIWVRDRRCKRGEPRCSSFTLT